MKTFNKPTLLRGFIPLVETNDSGTELAPVTGKALCIPAEERCRHMLVVGANGTGKSTHVMLPIMFADIDDPDRSLVVLDAQLALSQAVIDYARHVRGPRARIRYFNPLDPEHSTYWNPIAGIVDRAAALDMASSIAAGVPTGNQETQYFRIQAINHIANLIRATNRLGCGSLGEIRRIIEGGATSIRELGERASFEELISFGSEAYGNSNHQTTIAEMLNLLAAFYDERVVRVTSASELDFDELERRPTILIIALPEEAVARLRPLTNCLLHRLFEWIMRRGQQRGGALRRPIALHIDEFASAVGAIRDFPIRANTLRKRGLMITAAVQTLSQLQEIYLESSRSLLAAFNHQIFIPRLAADDAEYVSKLSGLTTVIETVTGAHGETQSAQPMTRPVLLPTEVDRPPKHPKYGPRMTFLLADTPPFQGYLPAVYEDPALAKFVAPGRAFRPPFRRRRYKLVTEDYADNVKMDNRKATPVDDYFGRLCRDLDLLSEQVPQGGGQPQREELCTLSLKGTEAWPLERRLRMKRALGSIGWSEAPGFVREWWTNFISANAAAQPDGLLQLIDELVGRNASASSFVDAFMQANTSSVLACLHYLDYLRLKNQHGFSADIKANGPGIHDPDDADVS